jgi:hypothetical protein
MLSNEHLFFRLIEDVLNLACFIDIANEGYSVQTCHSSISQTSNIAKAKVDSFVTYIVVQSKPW